jgi:hypothetical protein
VSSKPVGKIDLAVSIGHGDNKRKEELTFEVWRLRLRLHVWEDPFLVKCVAVGSLSRRAGREGGRGPEQQSCRASRQHGHDTGEAAPVLHARHRSLVFLLQRCCLLLKDRSPGPMNKAIHICSRKLCGGHGGHVDGCERTDGRARKCAGLDQPSKLSGRCGSASILDVRQLLILKRYSIR